MNLTSKRMLQFLSVCAGACALTAAAQTVFVADSFEEADIGSAAGVYGAGIYQGIQQAYTNFVWDAGAGDASTIQAFEGSYTGARPITNENPRAQVLKLETEGQTLTRFINFTKDDGGTSEGFPLTTPTTIPVTASDPVFVDTLMKFTPSEDDPEINDGSGIKLALFVNVNSNLVLRHKYYVNGNYVPVSSVFTDQVIDPEKWYRLTIKMQYNSGYAAMQAWLWLDGNQLTHYNGEVDENVLHNGPIFYTLSETQKTLEQVSFQGTGWVDDLVVAREAAPFSGGQTGITLTLVFDDDVLDVTVNSDPVADGDPVESGSTLVITAIDWYQINSITGEGISYDGDTGEQTLTSTGTITADGPGRTATIDASQLTGNISTDLGGAYNSIPADKLAAWAVKSGLSFQDVQANAADYLDNYLLNIDESIDAQIKITGIVYDPVTETATITVSATDPAVDFTKLNGTLVVQTADDLASGFNDADDEQYYEINLDEGEATIEVNAAGGSFIKATVK